MLHLVQLQACDNEGLAKHTLAVLVNQLVADQEAEELQEQDINGWQRVIASPHRRIWGLIYRHDC